MRQHRMLLSLVMAAIFLAAVTAVSAQEKPPYPIGQITLEATQVAAGLGYSWGDGTLNFEGKEYHFTVQGLNVAAVGLAKIKAIGDVYNLKTAADFPGTYLAASAGVAVAKGASGLTMRNDKGVVVIMKAAQQGVQLNLGVDGFTIKMK